MSERAASATAVLVCQGRAVADGRYAVGVFSDPIARRLLDPEDRAAVDRVRTGEVPAQAGARMTYEMLLATARTMVPRTVAIDAAVRDHGASQVVVLGAGLDARAWRMPELADALVLEVDHPASRRDKLRRVEGVTPTAGRVESVEVDLATQPLEPALLATGFDPGTETTWVWEGVVPYLTREAVRSSVAQVARLSARGSRLLVNYQQASALTSALRRLSRVALRVAGQPDPLAGEPWRSLWRPDRMRAMLAEAGFDVVSDRTLLELAAALSLPSVSRSNDRGSLGNGRVAVAVRR